MLTTSDTTPSDDTYAKLSAPFDVVYQRPGSADSGGGLMYVTGEQVASRLNQVLGVGGWSFRILQHDINVEADEVWALGELVAQIDGTMVVRQQFVSQKIKRSRSNGAPLDLGFDLKGAGTDCMKKCASLLGVGLYLSKKDNGNGRPLPRQGSAAGRDPQLRAGGQAPLRQLSA